MTELLKPRKRRRARNGKAMLPECVVHYRGINYELSVLIDCDNLTAQVAKHSGPDEQAAVLKLVTFVHDAVGDMQRFYMRGLRAAQKR